MSIRSTLAAAPIPASAGIGLRFPHHRHVLESKPKVGWFEVHPENYMAGGAPVGVLDAIRHDTPISLHAVGLSLGGADPVDREHLGRLKALVDRIEPGLISDHLSWSAIDGTYLADLLPLPYTEEALDVAARNIDSVQNALGRSILVENPSTYLAFRHSSLSEPEFLSELARRAGCGILCDVNNAFVSACNLGGDALAYLEALPGHAIGEIHLAGHTVRQFEGGGEIRIDDHGSTVDPAVWSLYERALALYGPVPTLIEWDTNIPSFECLEAESARAQSCLDRLLLSGGRDARVA